MAYLRGLDALGIFLGHLFGHCGEALLSLSFDDRWSLVGDIVDVRLMLCLLWSSSGGENASTYRFVVCLLVLGLWHGGLTCCGITLTTERKERSMLEAS